MKVEYTRKENSYVDENCPRCKASGIQRKGTRLFLNKRSSTGLMPFLEMACEFHAVHRMCQSDYEFIEYYKVLEL